MAVVNKPALKERRPVLIVVVAVVIVAALVTWIVVRNHRNGAVESFTGYVVSDNLYMSSPVAGTLATLSVQRGQRVNIGDRLFHIDPTVRAAQAEQARATVEANRAQVDQQRAALAHAREDVAAARSDADRYEAELRRLVAAQREKGGSVAQLDIDQARALYDGALRRRDAASTQLTSARAAISAAEAGVTQARAGVTSAQRELAELSPAAPASGRVEDIMFRPGESVPPNVPIISIVPDARVKVRFYVPEPRVNAYQPGRLVSVACDGCRQGMTARVAFVATSPEYTPPVIYSLDARQKLVFLVEAVPSNPRALLPGQPLDVRPANEASRQ